MKINFNRENITKYIIVGGLSLLTLVVGCKFSSDTKNTLKVTDIKNNKQYEENNSTYENDNIALPEGYVLENRNGVLYGVRKTTDIIPADKYYGEDCQVYYSLENHPGYTLVGDKGVKVVVEEILLQEEKTKAR